MPESAEASQLVVERLSKSYPTPTTDLTILDDISFELRTGDALAVMGPSGAGKSTLLHIIGTLDHPSSGSVRLNGTNPFELDETGLAGFRNRTVGFVFQDHHLLPQCSVLENVLVPVLASGTVKPEHESRARELIGEVGLTDRIAHLPSELSGGERQRVAIARALVNRPTLLLCDEPTGNLDRHSAERIVDLLLELFTRTGAILIAVTHSQDLARRLHKRAELRDGKLHEVHPYDG